jgi:hypothetical protein
VGQAEKPREPENDNNSQEPNDQSTLVPYFEIVERKFPEDYEACPSWKFLLSNIPVCYDDSNFTYKRPLSFGYRLVDVRPGACTPEFFFGFFLVTRGFNEKHMLTETFKVIPNPASCWPGWSLWCCGSLEIGVCTVHLSQIDLFEVNLIIGS